LNEINKLVIFLEKRAVSFEDINSEQIREYLLTLVHHAKSTNAYCHFILRNVLNLAYEAGDISEDLSWVCGNLRTPQGRNIPSAYTPEEVEALLNAVDRASPIGKRDYAILLLAARLGLRVSDIRTLTFDNIDWVSNQIRFEQCKTERDLALPLSEEIGWAIIEYIKNARPKTECKCVFVRHRPPYEAFGTNNNFAYMIGKYFTRAGIIVPHNKHHGMHSLRHSLASNLLADGTPMPVISEILGHADTTTTSGYMKIDVSQLRCCALDADFGGDFV
jgi:site-specific recombinase XerD